MISHVSEVANCSLSNKSSGILFYRRSRMTLLERVVSPTKRYSHREDLVEGYSINSRLYYGYFVNISHFFLGISTLDSMRGFVKANEQ